MRSIPWILAGLLALVPAHAIEVGQIDDFENASAFGWTTGHAGDPNDPNTISLETDCGDQGAGDDCLRIFSNGGNDSGSRLATINDSRWTGDYLATGVGGMHLRVQNISATNTTLEIRVAVQGFDVQGTRRKRVTRDRLIVERFAGYVEGSIRIGPRQMLTGTNADNEAILRTVNRVWLFHNPAGTPAPTSGVRAIALFDDIMAIDDSIFDANFEMP